MEASKKYTTNSNKKLRLTHPHNHNHLLHNQMPYSAIHHPPTVDGNNINNNESYNIRRSVLLPSRSFNGRSTEAPVSSSPSLEEADETDYQSSSSPNTSIDFSFSQNNNNIYNTQTTKSFMANGDISQLHVDTYATPHSAYLTNRTCSPRSVIMSSHVSKARRMNMKKKMDKRLKYAVGASSNMHAMESFVLSRNEIRERGKAALRDSLLSRVPVTRRELMNHVCERVEDVIAHIDREYPHNDREFANQVNAIVTNVMDPSNKTFYVQVFYGHISSRQVARMSMSEMAAAHGECSNNSLQQQQQQQRSQDQPTNKRSSSDYLAANYYCTATTPTPTESDACHSDKSKAAADQRLHVLCDDQFELMIDDSQNNTDTNVCYEEIASSSSSSNSVILMSPSDYQYTAANIVEAVTPKITTTMTTTTSMVKATHSATSICESDTGEVNLAASMPMECIWKGYMDVQKIMLMPARAYLLPHVDAHHSVDMAPYVNAARHFLAANRVLEVEHADDREQFTTGIYPYLDHVLRQYGELHPPRLVFVKFEAGLKRDVSSFVIQPDNFMSLLYHSVYRSRILTRFKIPQDETASAAAMHNDQGLIDGFYMFGLRGKNEAEPDVRHLRKYGVYVSRRDNQLLGVFIMRRRADVDERAPRLDAQIQTTITTTTTTATATETIDEQRNWSTEIEENAKPASANDEQQQQEPQQQTKENSDSRSAVTPSTESIISTDLDSSVVIVDAETSTVDIESVSGGDVRVDLESASSSSSHALASRSMVYSIESIQSSSRRSSVSDEAYSAVSSDDDIDDIEDDNDEDEVSDSESALSNVSDDDDEDDDDDADKDENVGDKEHLATYANVPISYNDDVDDDEKYFDYDEDDEEDEISRDEHNELKSVESVPGIKATNEILKKNADEKSQVHVNEQEKKEEQQTMPKNEADHATSSSQSSSILVEATGKRVVIIESALSTQRRPEDDDVYDDEERAEKLTIDDTAADTCQLPNTPESFGPPVKLEITLEADTTRVSLAHSHAQCDFSMPELNELFGATQVKSTCVKKKKNDENVMWLSSFTPSVPQEHQLEAFLWHLNSKFTNDNNNISSTTTT